MTRDARRLVVEGFVLAGGRSIRMGQDKALLNFEGIPLVELALRNLTEVTDQRRIVGDRPDLAHFAPVVMDSEANCGPLGGIVAALRATASEWNVFLPVDLPLLPPGFLRWMVGRVSQTGALATVPLLAGLPQPLAAVYDRALLPELERRLKAGETKTIRAIIGAAESLEWLGARTDFFCVETLAAAGHFSAIETAVPVRRWFENVNSRLDLDFSTAS